MHPWKTKHPAGSAVGEYLSMNDETGPFDRKTARRLRAMKDYIMHRNPDRPHRYAVLFGPLTIQPQSRRWTPTIKFEFASFGPKPFTFRLTYCFNGKNWA